MMSYAQWFYRNALYVFMSAVLFMGLAIPAQAATPEVRDVVTVATVNFHPYWGKNNAERIRDYAISAAKGGADIVVFPEMALTGYDVDSEKQGSERMQIVLAETVPGPSTDIIKEVATRYGVYIVFGMPEKQGNAVYNSAVVVMPDGKTASYRKIHPFGNENTWCKKGDSPLIINTQWGPIGIGICFDSYQFPELVRYYAAKGCRLYVNCTAQYSDPQENTGAGSFDQFYLATLGSIALANDIYVVSSNLTGLDRVTFFPGASMILGPSIRQTSNPGDPVYHIYAGSVNDHQQGVFTAAIDLSLATRSIYQPNPFTGTPDFRPELYKKLYDELAK